MPLSTGTRLGPYEILAPIGAGGMGEVYRARDTRLEREVAVKVLPESLLADAEALSRFEREAKAVAALSHPNIMAIHDFGRHDQIVYAVMELLEGDTLKERLFASDLAQRKALDYALQIVQGLAAAHGRGIVHRDLKPANIFVTRDSLVKILDFGLAKSVRTLGETSRTGSPTEPGIVLGTAGYMSPEQVRGAALDQRSDLFSFGLILYEMLAGEPAFRRETDVEIMMAILKEEPPPLSRAGRTVSPELADLVGHCLEKKPEERFQSARDLAFALKVVEREGRSGSGTRSGQAVSGAAAATGAETSIAVLPFRNLSADPQAEYFSDGMTEEIITVLSKIEGLHVASRTSAFAFKGRDEDVRKIGAALGVRTVLEGSVRQAGGQIRVTAQLINVADGYHLWSERYDHEMKNVFALQDEIARAIAETLKVRLLPAEETRLTARGTENVEAYNDYLKGRYFFNRREAPEAIVEFERALSRDPAYTAAYTGLADSYCIFGFYGGIATREAFSRARAAAEKAHELEPDSTDVHVSLGLVEHYFGWDLGRQEKHLRRAIELAPRSAVGYTWLSLRLCFEAQDRHAESLELARKAADLEPLSANVQTNVGWAYLGNRQFEEASREFRQALHIDPLAPYPLWALGLVYRLMGRHQQAVTTFEKALGVTTKRQSFYLGMLGAAYAADGRRQQALKVLEELQGRSGREYVAPHHLAFIHIPLGDTDEAFSCLERACAERNALMWWMRGCPIFDPLRDDARFPKLLEKVASE